jgi:hypothetical protein
VWHARGRAFRNPGCCLALPCTALFGLPGVCPYQHACVAAQAAPLAAAVQHRTTLQRRGRDRPTTVRPAPWLNLLTLSCAACSPPLAPLRFPRLFTHTCLTRREGTHAGSSANSAQHPSVRPSMAPMRYWSACGRLGRISRPSLPLPARDALPGPQVMLRQQPSMQHARVTACIRQDTTSSACASHGYDTV